MLVSLPWPPPPTQRWAHSTVWIYHNSSVFRSLKWRLGLQAIQSVIVLAFFLGKYPTIYFINSRSAKSFQLNALEKCNKKFLSCFDSIKIHSVQPPRCSVKCESNTLFTNSLRTKGSLQKKKILHGGGQDWSPLHFFFFQKHGLKWLNIAF